MNKLKFMYLFLVCLSILYGCNGNNQENTILPDLPEGGQAISLLGDTLYATRPGSDSASMQNYQVAKKNYESDPNNADYIIWYGRRSAYLGEHRDAIEIFSKGIAKFPTDARMYRHRGHRYISIRQFDKAIEDFESAELLIKGKEDRLEPDGQPNVKNIPLTTLHRNIWYHLGLAYYLKDDMEKALHVYEKCIKASRYDDNIVSTTHWLYMTLRRLKRDDQAKMVLENIHKDMDIIENMDYHKLCLFYKGEFPLEKLMDSDSSPVANSGIAYGVANWFLCNGDMQKAKEIYQGILKSKGWGSFAYIAAEADYAREFSK